MGWCAVAIASGDQSMGCPPHEQTQTSGNTEVHAVSDLLFTGLFRRYFRQKKSLGEFSLVHPAFAQAAARHLSRLPKRQGHSLF